MYIAGHVFVAEKVTNEKNLNYFDLMGADSLEMHDYSNITDRNLSVIQADPYYYLHTLADYHIHFGYNYDEMKLGWVYRNMGAALKTYYSMVETYSGLLKKDSKRGICHTLVEYCLDIYLEDERLINPYSEVKDRFLEGNFTTIRNMQKFEKCIDKSAFTSYINRVESSKSFAELVATAAARKFIKNYSEEDVDYFRGELLNIYARLDKYSMKQAYIENIKFVAENIKWNS